MIWAVAIILILGVGNFALHRAVFEVGRPAEGAMPERLAGFAVRMTLAAEFIVLLAALLLAANGWPELVWAYLGYTALNAAAGWAVLSGRI